MTGDTLRCTILGSMRAAGVREWYVNRFLREVRFPVSPKLLGTSVKVDKGTKQGVLTSVLYLAPSVRSVPFGGRNMCPFATPGCAAACLGHSSGRLAMSTSQNAQIWKTLAYLYARDWFDAQLHDELEALERRAARKGLRPACRLDGTSDTDLGQRWAARFPGISFYDYTKQPQKALRWARGKLPANYHVTFSLAETPQNRAAAEDVARAGGNVAAVFRTRDPEAFPDRFMDLPVLNGDTSDVRFEDPRGSIVGLTTKGPLAARDRSGFVQEVS